MGFGLPVRFIGLLQSVTTFNYSAMANPRTLQCATGRTNSSRSALSSRNRYLVTVRVRVTLRLAVYRQLLRLGDKVLETHDQ
jgi:hypothetical protein